MECVLEDECVKILISTHDHILDRKTEKICILYIFGTIHILLISLKIHYVLCILRKEKGSF